MAAGVRALAIVATLGLAAWLLWPAPEPSAPEAPRAETPRPEPARAPTTAPPPPRAPKPRAPSPAPKEAPGEPDALVHGLRDPSLRQPGPERTRWFLVGLTSLLSQPGRCEELLALYRSPELDPGAREDILELLSSTGSYEAQAALRSIAADSGGPEVLRRFEKIEHPEPETVDLLRERYEAAGPEARAVLAGVYGAEAGKLGEDGWLELAAGHVSKLAGDLAQSEDPEDRRALIAALAKTRLPEGVGPLLGQVGDPDTRAAAILALRDHGHATATRALLDLGKDAREDVREHALASLAALAKKGALDLEQMMELEQLRER